MLFQNKSKYKSILIKAKKLKMCTRDRAYMPALQGAVHKASAQQTQECGGILSVLLQEKKEESFKDKYA